MACAADDVDAGDVRLPSGTAALAVRLAEHAAGLATQLTGHTHAVDADAVLAHLLMPLVVGARPPRKPPRPVPSGGFVHDDTGDGDAALLAALLDEGGDAEAVSAAAQACFLPVAPYRAWRPASPVRRPTSVITRRRDPADVRVLDLTAMWAGPLCTLLCAEWGADVTTIEPAVRPDGLRGAPAQFAVLDRGKTRLDVDLRTTAGRAHFERLVAAADVLVESFSARVMPNLGYDPEALRSLNPRLTTVSIRAFEPDAPEAGWLAYGRGVHASSGLAVHDGRAMAAEIAYPDPLTGFAAFAAVLAALGAQAPPAAVTVSLAGTIAPLLAAGDRPLSDGDPTVIARLARATAAAMAAPISPTPR